MNDAQTTAPTPLPFADPTPLGLIGLAVACAALTPIAFGSSLTPAGLETAAWFCVLFGGGCQLLAGLMSFANRNGLGGTLLTAFSFNWFLNGWALLRMVDGLVPDATILLATDALLLLVFLAMTWAFGHFSGLLFAFLLDVVVLYACRVFAGVTGSHVLAPVVGVATVALALLALWIAFAMLLNPVAGRQVFRVPGPIFQARAAA